MSTTAEPGGPQGPAHPDFDRLAELDEGLLEPDAARELTTHVAGCAECTEAVERLRGVRTALADLPDPPMPDEVAGRLHALLIAAGPPAEPADGAPAGPGVTVLRPRRRVGGWLPAVAAVVAFLGVAGGVGYLWSSGGPGSSNANTSSAGAAQGRTAAAAPPAATVDNHTGAHYTSQSLRAAVPALVTGEAAHAAAVPTPSSQQSNAAEAPAAGADTAVPKALTPLDDQGKVLACAHNTGYDRAPLAVDYAYYEGQPRLIMIFPAAGDASRLVVVVAQPDCATNPNALFTTLFVSR